MEEEKVDGVEPEVVETETTPEEEAPVAPLEEEAVDEEVL